MKARACLQLIRPLNCAMVSLAVIVGCVIASGGNLEVLARYPVKIVLGALTGFFLAASAMVLNDYIDREIDAYNAPYRPIPSGRVKPREALVLAVLLGVVGLIASALISLTNFLIAATTYAVAVLYDVWGKKTGFLGNLMVSYTVMIPLPFAGALLGSINTRIIIFSVIIFLANTGREITKGIVDVVGDRVKGIKTLAVTFGSKTAAACAFLFYFLSVTLSIIPFMMGLANKLYLALVIIVDIIIMYSAASLLRKPTKENAYIVKKRVLYAMLLGLIAFMVSGIP